MLIYSFKMIRNLVIYFYYCTTSKRSLRSYDHRNFWSIDDSQTNSTNFEKDSTRSFKKVGDG